MNKIKIKKKEYYEKHKEQIREKKQTAYKLKKEINKP